ncbi:DNA-methyltransferase [Bacteroides finegoldii]|uniref:DNA-methyltransferase n=1 Tax=Bacteroides finegoldii TaxID=338188 RepID=UPI001E47B040|nr:site-specific DNA-methyltransferase [Bacteroides finegoldii]
MNMINKIYNEDCQEGIKRIPDASVDCILTDPPYLYLKGQKLERPFDERSLFLEFARVLKPNGFVVLFGRGTSFYRWNTILSELGFSFKEEVIWNKSYITSPLLPLLRVHETISIHCVGKGKINRCKVPYIEAKCNDIDSILADIKRLRNILHNPKSLKEVENFLINNTASYKENKKHGYHATAQTGFMGEDRCAAVSRAMTNGCTERTIIRTDLYKDNKSNKNNLHGDMMIGDRTCNVMSSMEVGASEKSIIKQARDHFSTIHPTQKPVRLIERLLALVTQPGDVVLDPFSGSCSTAVACINTNRKFIGFEIDKEYYDAGIHRINETLKDLKLVV